MKNLAKYLGVAAIAAVFAHLFSVHGAILATAFVGWVDANVGNLPQKRGEPGVAAGGHVLEFVQSWAKKTTDGNGTIYLVAEVMSDAIIAELALYNDALTGASSADVGVFEIDKSLSNLGTVDQTVADYYAGSPVGGIPTVALPKVDAGNIFLAATDISAGNAQGSPKNVLTNIVLQTITTQGAATNGFLNYGLKLWQLLGFTDPKWKSDSYAIGLRLNTAGSAAGNLVMRGRYIQG